MIERSIHTFPYEAMLSEQVPLEIPALDNQLNIVERVAGYPFPPGLLARIRAAEWGYVPDELRSRSPTRLDFTKDVLTHVASNVRSMVRSVQIAKSKSKSSLPQVDRQTDIDVE